MIKNRQIPKHRGLTRSLTTILMGLMLCSHGASADWFDDLKTTGSDEDLYRVLFYMPKGGDLHNHLSGAAFSKSS